MAQFEAPVWCWILLLLNVVAETVSSLKRQRWHMQTKWQKRCFIFVSDLLSLWLKHIKAMVYNLKDWSLLFTSQCEEQKERKKSILSSGCRPAEKLTNRRHAAGWLLLVNFSLVPSIQSPWLPGSSLSWDISPHPHPLCLETTSGL